MTQPDVYRKSRNLLVFVAGALAVASFASAEFASFWVRPFDYWLVWASFVSGFAAAASTLASLVFHLVMLDELRSN